MPKCDFCGEEALFVFRCSRCMKVFCAKHRICESHECKELASDRSPFSAPSTRESTATTNTRPAALGFPCPNCGSYEKHVFDYDLKTMTFKCHKCGKIWTLMKSTLEPVPSSETQENKEKTGTSEPSEAEAARRKRVERLLREGIDIDKGKDNEKKE